MYLKEFEDLLVRKGNPTGTSVLLILTWIMCADGNIDELELQQIMQIAKASGHDEDITSLIRIIKSEDHEPIQLATEIIKHSYIAESQLNFLQMCVLVSLSDKRLATTENHILRMMCDLFGMPTSKLSEIFTEFTGKSFPEPIDISRARVWGYRQSEQKKNHEREESKQEQKQERKATHRRNTLDRETALKILRLTGNPSIDEIKASYRRLAQIHHPDKFTNLGQESVAAATVIFQTVNNAYEYLVNNA